VSRSTRTVPRAPFAKPLAPHGRHVLALLGTPSLRRGHRLVPLVLRPKAMALVAYLALADGAVARRDLAPLLFPEAGDPRAALRWHLTYLRAAAPPLIARRLRAARGALALSVPTDVALFRLGAEVVSRHPGAPGAARTLSLYRGNLVAGLAVSASADFDTWLYVTQESLQRTFRRSALAFGRWALEAHRERQAIAPLARLVGVDPYCEEAHLMLIRTYQALGHTQPAAAAYERYARIVRRELAAEPAPALAMQFEGRRRRGPTLPREHLVALRDVTMHVVEWPGGEPAIVGIHGSAGMAHTFGALAARLAPTHRFVGVDLRGHGFSDKPRVGYELHHHVEDLRQVIEAMHLEQPVLLGHSAGGTIAAFVAARTDVSGLILLEAMIGDRAFTENAAAQAAPLATGLGRPVAGFDAYLDRWRARRDRFTDDAERLVDRWARFALAPLPDGTYRERALRAAVESEWASIIEADSLGTLARVRGPILIVQALRPWLGGRPYFTSGIVAAQMRAAPSAVLFVARHSDHSTIIRDPEPAMIDAILRFARPRFARPPGR